jgi:hypothetical protein
MGLDMYLRAEFYTSPYGDQFTELNTCIRGLLNIPVQIPVTEIKMQVMYWRKANQIHAWFVKHICAGTDDCSPANLDKEQLEQLLTACKTVLDAKGTPDAESIAREHLPTREGFFFGNYVYDDWYYNDVQDTLNALTPMLALAEHPNFTNFEYQASW